MTDETTEITQQIVELKNSAIEAHERVRKLAERGAYLIGYMAPPNKPIQLDRFRLAVRSCAAYLSTEEADYDFRDHPDLLANLWPTILSALHAYWQERVERTKTLEESLQQILKAAGAE